MARWGELKCPNCAVLEAKLFTCATDLDTYMNAHAALEAKLADCEARLTKAVAMALEECPFRDSTGNYRDWWHDRRTTLAELRGRRR